MLPAVTVRQLEGAHQPMLTHALRKRGWPVPAIARHLDRDRKTVRAYLAGQQEPGRRKPTGPDRFERFAEYCRIRFADDPHLFATALLEEVAALGYGGSYPSFTRALRARGLRPTCERCAAAVPAEFAMIGHPPGEETQRDWVELPIRLRGGGRARPRTC
jgi:transposase